MDNPKSLSTISEEPKSFKSATTPSTDYLHGSSSSSSSSEEGYVKPKGPLTLPPLPQPIPPREKRHTSKVMNKTSRELVVEHVPTPSRTASLKEDILFHIRTGGKPLFPKVLGEPPSTDEPSILITGFGLRNVASLQDALLAQEHKRLQELYRSQEPVSAATSATVISTSSSGTRVSVPSKAKSESSAETQTESAASGESEKHKQLSYLMGLSAGEEEGGTEVAAEIRIQTTGEAEQAMSEAMKQAKKYLRTHKIFEFFQFIISHLLSAIPEDPIEFIIALLDRCMLYRSGISKIVPVLYNRNHLESLFHLMDKMRTGYIDLSQYKTGMRTLGICTFNQKPFTTKRGLVRKTDFIEEAYESLTYMLDDMIRRRYINQEPPVVPPPPPTPQFSSLSAGADEQSVNYDFLRTHIFL